MDRIGREGLEPEEGDARSERACGLRSILSLIPALFHDRGIDRNLIGRFRAGNRARNKVVHRGASVSATDADTYVTTCADLV